MFAHGLRGLITVRTDGKSSSITAWNLWSPDYVSITM